MAFPTTSLLARFEAQSETGKTDGVALGTVTDQSGSGNSMTQGSATAQPTWRSGVLNGKAVYRFDGSNDIVSKSAVANTSAAMTMTVVMSSGTSEATTRKWPYVQENGSTAQVFGIIEGNPAGEWSSFVRPAGNPGTASNATSGVDTTAWTVITLVHDGAGSAMYRNGTLITTSTRSGSWTTQGFTMGGHTAIANEFFSGDIALAASWNVALDATARAELHTYVQDTFGITVSDYTGGAVIPSGTFAGTVTASGAHSGTAPAVAGAGGTFAGTVATVGAASGTAARTGLFTGTAGTAGTLTGPAPAPVPRERTLTIDNTGGAAKSQFPVRVALTSANWDFTSTAGTDLTFLAADGTTVLPHWLEAYDTTGQTGAVWVRLPSLAAGSSAQVTVRYGTGAQDTSDIAAVFPLGDDFTDRSTWAGADFGPADNYAANYAAYPNPITQTAAGTWKSSEVREQGNGLYDPDEANPARRYKLYYSANNGSVGGIGVLFSPDGVTWTDHPGNPVIASNAEDPYVVKVGGTYHLWSETYPNVDINHYTSSDGVTWTADAANPVFRRATSGQWDDALVGSPAVVWTGSQFVMLYEGKTGSTDAIGIATSPNGTTWTRNPANPVIASPTTGWATGSIVPDDVWQLDDAWVMTYHSSGVTASGLFRTTVMDPAAWTAGSWTAYGDGPYSESRTDMFVQNTGAIIARYGLSSLVQLDGLGGTIWRGFARGPLLDRNATTAKVDVVSGALALSVTEVQNGSVGLFTHTAPATSGFAVGARRKMAPAGNDKYGHLMVGSGALGVIDSAEHNRGFADGYQARWNEPGTATALQLYRVSGGAGTLLQAANVSAAVANNYARHELRLLASGAVSYVIDGTLVASGTDAAHVAAAKDLLLSQGQRTTNDAAVTSYDWLYVRPFDGVDPSVTVGPQVEVTPAGTFAGTVATAGTLTGAAPSVAPAAGTFSGATTTAGAVQGLTLRTGSFGGTTASTGALSGTAPVLAVPVGTAGGAVLVVGSMDGSAVHSGDFSGYLTVEGVLTGPAAPQYIGTGLTPATYARPTLVPVTAGPALAGAATAARPVRVAVTTGAPVPVPASVAVPVAGNSTVAVPIAAPRSEARPVLVPATRED